MKNFKVTLIGRKSQREIEVKAIDKDNCNMHVLSIILHQNFKSFKIEEIN